MPKPRRGEVYRLTLGDRERVVVVISADSVNAGRQVAIVALLLMEVAALVLPTVAAIPDGEDIAGQIRLDTLWILKMSELAADRRVCALSDAAMSTIARPIMATFDLLPPALT